MLTDTETLKMKRQILDEISQKYQHLLAEKQLTEEESTAVLGFMKTKLATAHHSKEFSEQILAFCEQFAPFASIAEKVKNHRSELLQTAGRESIEDLIEADTEKWSELSEKLEEVDENNVRDWVVELPKANKTEFFKKTIHLDTKPTNPDDHVTR